MRIHLSLLFLIAFFIQVKAQVDTGSTRPLLINKECIKFDESDWSARKNIYTAESFKDLQIRSSCDIDSFPSVDFNKNLLLWISYSYSGCENAYRKFFYSIDHPNKKLTVLLLVPKKGICKVMHYRAEFFPIPIIPNSYSIEIYSPEKTVPTIIPGE